MNQFVQFSIFDVGKFSLLTAPKIASRRLEGVTRELNKVTPNKSSLSSDFKGTFPTEWKYFFNDVQFDINDIPPPLKKIKYFVIRNPYERCLSGFIQHFHTHFLRNEFSRDTDSVNFWTYNSTKIFDVSKDTTANLDILFNPFPTRNKTHYLQKEFFEERQSLLDSWLIEWNQWFVDNIKFAIENNMLGNYLLSDDHHAPYLILYDKLINSPIFFNNDIEFIKMEDLDTFLGVTPEVTDSLGVFKKVDDSLFKDFYNSSLEYKPDNLLWNFYINKNK